MSAGLQWNERTSYANPANSESQMINSNDPIDYILSQPLVDTPGTLWNYSGGCTQLLASIVQQVSGMDIYAYAQQYLFAPFGISLSEWAPYPGSNLFSCFFWTSLKIARYAQIGQLLLNNGDWQGTQVIDSSWISDSFAIYFNKTCCC